MEDFYIDNFVLEDIYNIITNYKLDSVKFSIIISTHKNNPYSYSFKNRKIEFKKKHRKIKYGKRNYFLVRYGFGTIWNGITRANIITKGLYLLNSNILNAYKNFWEDQWWNRIINEVSFSHLFINRKGYLYLIGTNEEGAVKVGDANVNNKMIREIIYFWLFDLGLLPKDNNKKEIIKILMNFNNKNNMFYKKNINLSYLIKKFEPYEILLNSLLEDNYVLNEDKEFIKALLDEYYQRINQNHF